MTYLDTVKGLLDWAPVMGWGTPLALLANFFQNSHSAEALGGIPLTKRFPFWRFADLPKTARSTYITVPRRSVIKEIQTRIQRSSSGRLTTETVIQGSQKRTLFWKAMCLQEMISDTFSAYLMNNALFLFWVTHFSFLFEHLL